jgi:hypothetical protein
MNIRQATMEDLDVITQLDVDAFLDDPLWVYRYPKQSEFPEETYQFTREYIKSILLAPEKFTVILACTANTEDSSTSTPIALSIWTTANIQSPPNVPDFGQLSIEPSMSHFYAR